MLSEHRVIANEVKPKLRAKRSKPSEIATVAKGNLATLRGLLRRYAPRNDGLD